MLEISQSLVSAFQKDALASELAAFGAWWRKHAGLLATISEVETGPLLDRAKIAASEVGIADNDLNRIWIQAVALHLMPEPSARQFLLATDAIFTEKDDKTRLMCLAQLSWDP